MSLLLTHVHNIAKEIAANYRFYLHITILAQIGVSKWLFIHAESYRSFGINFPTYLNIFKRYMQVAPDLYFLIIIYLNLREDLVSAQK